MKEEIEELTMKGIIKKVLLEHPQSRDDDQILIDFVEREAHHLFISKQGGLYTPPVHLVDRFKPESITRTKRKLQALERENVKPDDWRIQPSKEVKKLKEEEEVKMRYINEWFPVSDGSHIQQTCLFLEG